MRDDGGLEPAIGATPTTATGGSIGRPGGQVSQEWRPSCPSSKTQGGAWANRADPDSQYIQRLAREDPNYAAWAVAELFSQQSEPFDIGGELSQLRSRILVGHAGILSKWSRSDAEDREVR